MDVSLPRVHVIARIDFGQVLGLIDIVVQHVFSGLEIREVFEQLSYVLNQFKVRRRSFLKTQVKWDGVQNTSKRNNVWQNMLLSMVIIRDVPFGDLFETC
jgi:hypothetical protein